MANESTLVSDDLFSLIVSSSPLVSVDLVIENYSQKILLGLRENRPAKGYWFVPGGRITKNEKICDAIDRVLKKETGLKGVDYQKRFIGVVEHFYSDSAFGDNSEINTHYIAIAYHITADYKEGMENNDDQHSELRWFPKAEIIEEENVHHYSQEYFSHL